MVKYTWAGAVGILVAVIPLRAFFLMLGLGVLHNDWSPAIPALGFWASVILSLAVTAVTAVWSRPGKS